MPLKKICKNLIHYTLTNMPKILQTLFEKKSQKK